mmetsp:Transcript_11437/g.23447  ORF Transcript_11437/g.23447 Transcript_11437/m.23447 type:complete len:318 (-) Transcript_11437:1209-2162(-)
MLHGMRNIRSLNDVFNHNGSLSVQRHLWLFVNHGLLLSLSVRLCAGVECTFPSVFSHGLEISIKNIRGHETIDNKFSESLDFEIGLVNRATQINIFGFHQHSPRNIKAVLFGDRLVLVVGCQINLLVGKLSIGDTAMINVMDERGKDQGKMSHGVTGDSKCAIVSLQITSNFLRRQDSRQELGRRLDHVTSMLKTVKGIATIASRNRFAKATSLGNNLGRQLRSFGFASDWSIRLVKLGQLDKFGNFVHARALPSHFSFQLLHLAGHDTTHNPNSLAAVGVTFCFDFLESVHQKVCAVINQSLNLGVLQRTACVRTT